MFDRICTIFKMNRSYLLNLGNPEILSKTDFAIKNVDH